MSAANPPPTETEPESFPIFTRLLRDRVKAGRSAELEQWSADAHQRLSAHATANPNPKLRKDVEKITRAYDLADELLTRLDALAKASAKRPGT